MGRRHRRHSPGNGDVRRAFNRRKHFHGSCAQIADGTARLAPMREKPDPARRAGKRPRPGDAGEAPGRGAKASGRDRPRAVARRASRDHGRTDRSSLGTRNRGPFSYCRASEKGWAGDSVHFAQVRRNLPHRRPVDLLARRRACRRRIDRRDVGAAARQSDGRTLDRQGLPQDASPLG